MPALSVLMPCKDSAETVELAVRSTLRAMPRDSEFVVWDDASTDATSEAVEEIADPRVKVIRSTESLGPGGAMQSLMERTDSRWIARMDADDVSAPWRFAAQLPALRDAAADYVFSSIVSFRRRPLRLRPEIPLPIEANAMPLHLAVTNLLSQPSMTAVRTAVVDAGGYRAMLASDYDLWLRACARGQRLVRIGTPCVGYRHHDRQVSASTQYQRRIDTNPLIHEAYRVFMKEVLDIDVDAEAAPDGIFPRADPVSVRSAITARSPSLSTLQRVLLRRTLRLLPPAS